MIKMIYAGKKQPDKTWDEFRKNYLEHHAPLFLRTVPQACKFTINFPAARPGNDPLSLDFDFITKIWWEDIEAIGAFYNSDEYKQVIEPDEKQLFATGSAIYFDEFVQKA